MIKHNSILGCGTTIENIPPYHNYCTQVFKKKSSLMLSVTFQYSKGARVARLEPCTTD